MKELSLEKDLFDILVGSVSFGGLLGCVVAGKLADIVGRKRAMGLAFLLITIGYVAVTSSYNIAMIFSGRVVHGISEGMIVVVSIVYLSEFMQNKYRGGALACNCVAVIFGMALANILGAFLPWRVCTGLITATNLACFLLTFLSQESPQWIEMRKKGNLDQEENSEKEAYTEQEAKNEEEEIPDQEKNTGRDPNTV